MRKRSSWAIVKAVVFALVLRELLTRLSMRRMGAFWLIVEPTLYVVVMLVERTWIRNLQIDIGGMNYAMFLITGLVPYMLFRQIAFTGMAAIDANRNLFAYRQIQPLDCIVARAIVECLVRLPVYVMLLLAMGFWFGYDVGIAYPLKWFGVLCLGILFSLALAIIFAIWAETMPNIRIVLAAVFMAITFLSDSIFPVSKLPFEIQRWLAWNPFLQLNVQLRQAISPAYPQLPGVGFDFVIFVTLALLLIGLGLYRARRDNLVSA